MNGIDIADHAGAVEVPGSAATGLVAKGQIRYLWRDLGKPAQMVEKLTLTAFSKTAAPLVAALTLESPDQTGTLRPPPPVGGPARLQVPAQASLPRLP